MVELNRDPPDVLMLSVDHFNAMREDVIRRAPQEACGLVASRGQRTIKVYPITNILQSSTRYRMDPEEQLQAFNNIDNHGWELSAIYHSHPNGPSVPSLTDLEEAAYPNTIYIIWSRDNQSWICRGFLIREKQIKEVTIRIEEDQ